MRPLTCSQHELIELRSGWELAETGPGANADPSALDGLEWSEAEVPGTVAAALPGIENDALDGRDWWFRCAMPGRAAGEGEELVLALDGIATVVEVWVDGTRVAGGESMFTPHAVALERGSELTICCRALTPRLRERRKPRARWRTRLVSEGNLRFFRTMLLGRAPGFAPGPAVVGPWRPARLEYRREAVIDDLRLTPRVDRDGTGVLEVKAAIRSLRGPVPETSVVVSRGGEEFEADLDPGSLRGECRIPGVARWWPHTHGEPALYGVSIRVGETLFDAGRVGFRELDCGADPEQDGLALSCNGVPVFARGAVWTPLSLERPHAEGERLRATLTRACDAGLNMLRIPGTGCYESDEFHALCDELGILVWQDFMFANLDYPEADAGFMALVAEEARAELSRLEGRPSLAVLCGSSEVAQQVAMLGLDPALADGPLYRQLLPGAVAAAGLDAAYVPSAPCGGELPFRPDRGIANYYGVGGYRRGFDDVRRSEVKFAAECLALANVPDESALASIDAPAGLTVHSPAWKAGVPRDVGSGWDFDDIRDHYLMLLFGLDPVALRSVDAERYLELSRAVSGEVMAEVYGEWRRRASPTGGALVLWLKDLVPGAGWGLLDHRGDFKPALHVLRRALTPVAVWGTDEGLGGVMVHVANDRPSALTAKLRIALYRDLELCVEQSELALTLAGHETTAVNLEAALGKFVDVSWAYRFGPPAQDLVALSLYDSDGALLSQSFRFPAGRPVQRERAERLGVSARVIAGPAVRVASTRFAYGVRLEVPGFETEDDWFSIEPGGERLIGLTRLPGHDGEPSGRLRAVNLAGSAPILGQFDD